MRNAVGSLPKEDEQAVQRLAALGFAREQAAEAYLACERNEMLAAQLSYGCAVAGSGRCTPLDQEQRRAFQLCPEVGQQQ